MQGAFLPPYEAASLVLTPVRPSSCPSGYRLHEKLVQFDRFPWPCELLI